MRVSVTMAHITQLSDRVRVATTQSMRFSHHTTDAIQLTLAKIPPELLVGKNNQQRKERKIYCTVLSHNQPKTNIPQVKNFKL